MSESARFLEIDKLRVERLEKLRAVESELETEREELRILRDVLAKEREVSSLLADERGALMGRIDSLTESFNAERDVLVSKIENSEESAFSRVEELEGEVLRLAEVVESVRRDRANLDAEVQVLQMENKSLKGSASTRQADFALQIDRLNREILEVSESKNRAIGEQRAMIDQLSNSMSEAATQLMESQDVRKFHQSEVDKKEVKILDLEETVSSLEESHMEKNRQICALEDRNLQLEKRIDQLGLEKEIVLAQLSCTSEELSAKNTVIRDMQILKGKSQLIQSHLVSELQSLPIINKRLEADCAFLRDDMKKLAEKLKAALVEIQSNSEKLKILDSLLTPEQRIKLNSVSKTGNNKTESAAIMENKRLQIEAMELRMRLVDSQAARDKAQTQLIDQSQLIAKLQKDLMGSDENALCLSPSRLPAVGTDHNEPQDRPQECKQQ